MFPDPKVPLIVTLYPAPFVAAVGLILNLIFVLFSPPPDRVKLVPSVNDTLSIPVNVFVDVLVSVIVPVNFVSILLTIFDFIVMVTSPLFPGRISNVSALNATSKSVIYSENVSSSVSVLSFVCVAVSVML